MKKIIQSSGFLLILLAVSAFAQQKTENRKTSNPLLSYGIVVDNSGSARASLDKIISIVKLILRENNDNDETFLVRFVNSETIKIVEEMTRDRAKINASAEDFYVEAGETAIVDAVDFSAKYLKESSLNDADRRRFLILISDGDERKSAAKIEDVLKYLKENNVTVFSIGISDEKIVRKTLEKLANGTGGKLILPKLKFDAAGLVKELNDNIRAQ